MTLIFAVAARGVAAQALPVSNLPAVHLGDSELQVRRALNVHAAPYPSPFAARRVTLHANDHLLVDFEQGHVVEVDVLDGSLGVHLGPVAVGTELTAAKTALGVTDPGPTFAYQAQKGEVIEIRSDGRHVAAFALIGDATHAPAQRHPLARIVIRNSGTAKPTQSYR